MASDVRRFVTYLRDNPRAGIKPDASVNDGQFVQAPRGKEHGIRQTGTIDLDYDEARRLLSKFKNDDRVRHVLMESSDEALEAALEKVQHELQEVENNSITAYIGEAEPLNHLHGLVIYFSIPCRAV